MLISWWLVVALVVVDLMVHLLVRGVERVV
jgi:hypothetical protein